ncbi:hypothetical protein Tco_0072794 [Tanacetum coccineum]
MIRTFYRHGLTKGTIIQIFYRGLDDPTQGILDAGGIFLYKTPNEAFKILEDKVLLKLDFLDDSQNPKPKTIVSSGGSNIIPDHELLTEKFEALARKINSEFLFIRKELKEMRDGGRDNHASQIYMKDDTPMCDPMKANYVHGYHEGYHDRKPINSYSYPNHDPNHNYHRYQPPNRMPRPSRYFKLPKTLTYEMIREWMASQTEANERMKNQVVELERKINQGLRNRQAIIENLERHFKYLEKTQHTKSFPCTTNTKLRHKFVYKPPSIQNENDKGDVAFIKEDETEPIPTMPNPNLIHSNSPSVSPFLKDCTVHIPYTNAKTFADDVLLNHVGDKKLKLTGGVRNGVLKEKEIKKDEMGVPKEPNKDWKLNEKVVPHNKEVYHYLWHPTKIPHLNRIIKES